MIERQFLVSLPSATNPDASLFVHELLQRSAAEQGCTAQLDPEADFSLLFGCPAMAVDVAGSADDIERLIARWQATGLLVDDAKSGVHLLPELPQDSPPSDNSPGADSCKENPS